MPAYQLFGILVAALVAAWAITRVMKVIPPLAYVFVIVGAGCLSILAAAGLLFREYIHLSDQYGLEFINLPVRDKASIAWALILDFNETHPYIAIPMEVCAALAVAWFCLIAWLINQKK